MSNVEEVTSLLAKEPNQDGVDFSNHDLIGAKINNASFIYATFDKVKLENFINHPGNDSLFELTKKIVKDNELFGGYALEVIVTKEDAPPENN